MGTAPITPEQIRNSAKSGTPIRAESLLEIADRLEAAEKNAPAPALISPTNEESS